MKWVGPFAFVGKEEMHTEFLVVRPEDLGIAVLKWIHKKQERGRGLVWSLSRYGQVEGCCDHGNESSYSIKCREFID